MGARNLANLAWYNVLKGMVGQVVEDTSCFDAGGVGVVIFVGVVVGVFVWLCSGMVLLMLTGLTSRTL